MFARIFLPALLGVFFIQLAAAPTANAAYLFLTGAQLYAAADSGGLSGSIDNSYRHTTNATDVGASALGVVAGSVVPNVGQTIPAIALTLLTGDETFAEKVFSFDTYNNSSPGGYVGLNLFFGTAQIAYNPSGATVAGHLSVEKQLDTETVVHTFSNPSSSKFVQNYAFGSASSNKPNANGYGEYTIGEFNVKVIEFTARHSDTTGTSGSFKIRVTATPEPATLGLGGIAVVGLIGFMRSRKKRGNPTA